ncbi:hypothetical protein [Pseudomonas sp. S2.OTC.A_B10]|uniref:hypothetical protein n=1 Tax=Pseudomonas sp. S2.OTC.A_B10 TaxID=3237018 RepID=UPI003CE6D013
MKLVARNTASAANPRPKSLNREVSHLMCNGRTKKGCQMAAFFFLDIHVRVEGANKETRPKTAMRLIENVAINIHTE